jgi:hypothetical protein
MPGRAAVLLLAFSLCLPAGTREVTLRRDELADVLVNFKATITTLDGRRTKARVLAVNSQGISTSDRARPLIPYLAIREIRMTEHIGRGRAIGMAVGGGLGLLIGLTAAGVIGISGDSGMDKAAVALLGLGAMPAGMLAGRLIGRQADRQTVIITIAP